MYFYEALHLGKEIQTINRLRDRAKELNIFNHKAEALLQGRDLIALGLKPSTEFSKLLNEAYEAQIHSLFSNHKEALLWLKKRVNLS
jgi:tRNA nucleotidyltransferase (CCA-adding enzyme)